VSPLPRRTRQGRRDGACCTLTRRLRASQGASRLLQRSDRRSSAGHALSKGHADFVGVTTVEASIQKQYFRQFDESTGRTGIVVPTKRHIHPRTEDGTPYLSFLPITLDISDVTFS
jgi:hypothetical protein